MGTGACTGQSRDRDKVLAPGEAAPSSREEMEAPDLSQMLVK